MSQGDKPMTVKERLAALTRASSGGSTGPPATSRPTSSPSGVSVAERLAKMRQGSTGSAAVSTGGPGGSPKRPVSAGNGTLAARNASAAAGTAESTGRSSIADRIAKLSAGGSEGSNPAGQKPPGGQADSKLSLTPALAQPLINPLESSLSENAQNNREEADGSFLAEGSDSRRVSPELAARMQAMKTSSSSAGSHHGAPEPSVTSGTTATEERGPPAPPSSRMSPALAARMQALEGAPRGLAGGGGDNREPNPSSSGPKRMGSVGLPGLGMAIPMPGAMPPGGLAELKRRKEAAERAEASPAEETAGANTASACEQKPGELQHANLSRATIPQRRRPRRAARPFKGAFAQEGGAQTSTAAAATEQAVVPQVSETLSTAETPASNPETREANRLPNPGEDVPQAVHEPEAEVTTAAPADAASTPQLGTADKMKSMLQAAKAEVENGDEDDADWE